MTKVLFLISAVVMAVACFFSWKNRETFVDTRKARQKIQHQINSELSVATKAANEVDEIKRNVAAASTDMEAEKARKEQAEIKLRNLGKDFDNSEAALAAAEDEMNKIRKQFKDLPEGVTPETLGEKINQLKTTVAENENKAKTVEETVAAKEKEAKKATDELGDIQKRIEDRRKLYDRNSLSARIIAVNNDWGFVVIDGGHDKGITTDTKLIITRGADTIGRLNIVAVEGNRTVANIDQKSIRRGMAVAPGDGVILETLYQ